MSAKDQVKQYIQDNDVMVFSKSYCPYCKRAKALLNELDANATVVELDEIEDGPDMQAYVRSEFGHGSVPAIFIKQKLLGGNDDLQAAHQKGELKKLIGGKL